LKLKSNKTLLNYYKKNSLAASLTFSRDIQASYMLDFLKKIAYSKN